MEETHVVTSFLRHGCRVLLLGRSREVGTYPGRWAGVSGHAEGDPDGAARWEIREETGLDAVSLIRSGESLAVEDGDTRWVVHPYLFETDTRDIETNYESSDFEWIHPTDILRRDTVPDLWMAYDRVRPTTATVTGDREHGSAWISIRALEVLRDEAGIRATGRANPEATLTEIAGDLREARQSMPVIENRVNRVMAQASEAGDPAPEAIEQHARTHLESAISADVDAARTATERLPDRIVTLSRSGTVIQTVERADIEAVLVAESRPGREGITLAEDLADRVDVTLATDGDLAWAIHEFEPGALLIGADAIRPDGAVINKVGSRGAALAAAHEGCDVFVAATRDKITTSRVVEVESVDPGEIYDGDCDLTVRSPLFDVTPPDLIDGICTEDGLLENRDIETVVEAHRQNRQWSA